MQARRVVRDRVQELALALELGDPLAQPRSSICRPASLRPRRAPSGGRALVVPGQPVVGDRLPRGRVRDELPVLRPDAGIAVERAEPDADDPGSGRAAAPERAAAGRAEALRPARRPAAPTRARAPRPRRSAARPAASGPEPRRPVPERRWQRVQWQYDAETERLVDLVPDAAAEAAAGQRGNVSLLIPSVGQLDAADVDPERPARGARRSRGRP